MTYNSGLCPQSKFVICSHIAKQNETRRMLTLCMTYLGICNLKKQGTKLTFLARSHLAPKFSKLVAKAKKLGAIKKKIVVKTYYTVMSNGRVFLD